VRSLWLARWKLEKLRLVTSSPTDEKRALAPPMGSPIQPGRFRIMCDKLAVAGENRQCNRLRFHPWFTQWLRMKTQMVPNRMTNNTMAKKMKRLRATRFSVAHRTEAVHAAGSQIGDQPRIVRGRPAEMVPNAVEKRGQIVFADAQFVKLVGRSGLLVSDKGFTSSKTGSCTGGGGDGAGFVRAGDGRTVRNGGGTKFRRGHALKLRIELLDFGFKRGNLVGEGARTVGSGSFFFLRGPHTTISAPHQNGDQHAQRGQGQHQRPGHRQTKSGITRQNWHWRTATARVRALATRRRRHPFRRPGRKI